jgi:hypothetical protein
MRIIIICLQPHSTCSLRPLKDSFRPRRRGLSVRTVFTARATVLLASFSTNPGSLFDPYVGPITLILFNISVDAIVLAFPLPYVPR